MSNQYAPITYRIETPRLVIRTPVVSDASAIRMLLEDIDLDTDDKVVKRIELWNTRASENKDAFLSVILRETGVVIGYMTFNCFRTKAEINGIEPIRKDPLPGIEGRYLTDVGCVLHHALRRKGYGLEVMFAIFEHAFEILKCQIVRMETEWTNMPWRGLIQALGLGGLETGGQFTYGFHMMSTENPMGCIYLIDRKSWQRAKERGRFQ